MARILLLHSVFGFRPAVRDAAERLRAAGHEVHTPEYLDGKLFEDVEEGLAYVEDVGKEQLMRRVLRTALPLMEDGRGPLTYAGFSLGGSLAQNLALNDENASGLLLFHGTSDIQEDAHTEMPVQLHVAEPDPFEPEDWLNAWYLNMLKAGADVEIHRYRGAGHLFTDPSLPDYDEAAAERAWLIADAFLAELD
ncbi:dienelactone hydrolase family protein [Phaeacidiphilus oryzae]|uniref:dienelactone hydrolase family protein n=1 Tax=Phaeacidiphilus oryzae TaxID=348818 RepID=UPI0005611E31|nr:dienelactone hydrolase family protein [Phaeacidiphilus oryzae]